MILDEFPHVSRETSDKLGRYVALLKEESTRQNLIAPSTVEHLWDRHVRDSAQLATFATDGAAWIDIGSGAGLPGVIIAILTEPPMTLAEPRKLRAEFLTRVVDELDLKSTGVVMRKAEQVSGKYDIITARAVASLSKLLGITLHLSHPGTSWVLPKGRSAKSELAEALRSWHYDVRAEPSCTDPDASILLLSNVRAKSTR